MDLEDDHASPPVDEVTVAVPDEVKPLGHGSQTLHHRLLLGRWTTVGADGNTVSLSWERASAVKVVPPRTPTSADALVVSAASRHSYETGHVWQISVAPGVVGVGPPVDEHAGIGTDAGSGVLPG